jgi:AcrR family transcriptional regulator
MTEEPNRPGTQEEVPEDTGHRILQAAALVFAERGYTRATTRALAAAAGVNEVTLFRHFGSKKNLFAAVLQQYGGPALSAELEGLLSGDYRQDLLAVGKLLMQVLWERRDAMRLMLCEAAHFPEVQSVMVENPRQLRLAMARYFQQQIERGRVRAFDPEALAQAFIGMFFSYTIGRGILEDEIAPALSIEDLVVQFVDLFIDGTVE